MDEPSGIQSSLVLHDSLLKYLRQFPQFPFPKRFVCVRALILCKVVRLLLNLNFQATNLGRRRNAVWGSTLILIRPVRKVLESLVSLGHEYRGNHRLPGGTQL